MPQEQEQEQGYHVFYLCLYLSAAKEPMLPLVELNKQGYIDIVQEQEQGQEQDQRQEQEQQQEQEQDQRQEQEQQQEQQQGQEQGQEHQGLAFFFFALLE